MSPSSEGSLPDNWLPDRFRFWSFVRSSIHDGTDPVSLLFARPRFVRLVRLLSWEGMVPVS